MKKTLFTLSVLLTAVCCTLAFASHSKANRMNAASAESSEVPSNEDVPNYGVSIGTVEAQNYSESGLNLSNFSRAEYVAQINDDTYMGFQGIGQYVYNEEEDESVYVMESVSLSAICSTDEAVTIPDSVKINGDIYPVSRIDGYSYLTSGFTTNIKVLTVPSTVKSVNFSDYNRFDRYLSAIYMLGSAPSIEGYNSKSPLVPNVYVCNKRDLASYKNNSLFSQSAILPYGWDYEWITVNVEKNGEFAETYLIQNDYDWDAASYVKVVGNINDTDLSAIKNLTSLIKLDLSETAITSLPIDFMAGRSSLVEVKLPSTLESLGDYAFSGCSALKSFDLNGITTIGTGVFSGCRSLSYINLTGVNRIGASAFENCTSINNIDLSTVEFLGSGAFYGCTSLEIVNLSSIITIGEIRSYLISGNGCFENCKNLVSVAFGGNLTTIGNVSFEDTGLKEVVLPEGVKNIGENAFRECTNLVSVELPSTLARIDQGIFKNCTSLTEVKMKTGLKSIGVESFYGCTSLEEVSIPSTVTSIGSGAFNGTGIKNFKCYAVVPPMATYSFIGDNMDMSRTYLYVPPFSKDFYRNTKNWTNFYIMRSIEERIDYILVDRPLTINLEEEDNDVVANNPEIVLSTSSNVGQLTATGEGTLSAGKLTINGTLANRQDPSYGTSSSYQYCPTLINYADKMRADNVTHSFSFYNSSSSSYSNGVWHFISLPYDVKVSDIIPSNDTYWVIRRYDSAARAAGETSATWVNLTNDDTMEAGKGYIISATGGEHETDDYGNLYIRPRLTFTSGNSLTKNNLFRSTDIVVPLTEYVAEFAHNRSWNLVGNPYPCYFDMHYLNEDFTAPITIWDGRVYKAYSPVDDDLVLSPYEAFFVQCPLDATEITFKEGGRLHSDEGRSLYKASAVNRSNVSTKDRNVFNFEVKSEDYSDRARIVLNTDAAMEYELGRDASKFFVDNSDCAQIYVAADVNYSISERPLNDGIATLGVRASKEDVYALSLSGYYSPDWHVLLTDNMTGANIDLTEADYQFTTTAGDSNNRFSLKFINGNETGIDSVISELGEDANIMVCSLDGMSVYSGKISEIIVPSAGIYIISAGKEVHKVFLK